MVRPWLDRVIADQCYSHPMMTIEEARQELLKHDLSTFRQDPPGVITPGCQHCRKRMQTISDLMHHLADDVLPEIFRDREPGDEG